MWLVRRMRWRRRLLGEFKVSSRGEIQGAVSCNADARTAAHLSRPVSARSAGASACGCSIPPRSPDSYEYFIDEGSTMPASTADHITDSKKTEANPQRNRIVDGSSQPAIESGGERDEWVFGGLPNQSSADSAVRLLRTETRPHCANSSVRIWVLGSRATRRSKSLPNAS